MPGSAGSGSETGSRADKLRGKAVLETGGAGPLGTPQGEKYLQNRKKMLNRRNELTDVLQAKELGSF